MQERFDTENGGQSIKVCLTIAPAGASRPYVPDGESAAASLRPVGAETADVTQAPAPPQVYCSRLRFDDWVRYNIENNSSFYEMHSGCSFWVATSMPPVHCALHAPGPPGVRDLREGAGLPDFPHHGLGNCLVASVPVHGHSRTLNGARVLQESSPRCLQAAYEDGQCRVPADLIFAGEPKIALVSRLSSIASG